MPFPTVARRTARLALALAALGAAAACNDSTSPEEHDDEVESIRLTILQGATQYGPYVVRPGAAVTPAPFRIPVGASTVTAEFLAADGDVVTDLDAEYRLQIESVVPATAMTFTRTGQTTGTLAAPAAGTATATICLQHDDHCDVEALAVPVTIGG